MAKAFSRLSLIGSLMLVLVVLGFCPFQCRTAQADPAQAPDADLVKSIIDKVKPALIRIQVVDVSYSQGREVKMETAGSGVIISQDGYAVTNHHVAGDSKRLFVTLANKKELEADLVGTDPLSDIAVIKLIGDEGERFPVAEFGDSSKVRVGDRVLAMGSPMSVSQSVTMGIVSNDEMIMPSLMWPFDRLTLSGEDVGSMVRWIGHDARIAGGNSGGPLVNLQGKIVGINEISMGLSGAIPSNIARDVARQLIDEGKVKRSWLGIAVQPMLRLSKDRAGALVAGVVEGSPADKAGVKSGDIILEVNGNPVSVQFGEEVPLFNQLIAGLPIGKPARLLLERESKKITIEAVTQEREPAQPKEREFRSWGMTARNISFFMAKELERKDIHGAIVTSIARSGPSADAKPPLQENDIIVEVDGKPVKSIQDLERVTREVIGESKERVPALVAYDRKTERYLTVVRLGQEPLRDPGLEASKAWLPVGMQVLTADIAEALKIPGRTGVRVTEVYPGLSAEKAGLKVGDVIVALDGEPIEASQPQDYEVLPAMVRQKTIGDTAEFVVLRDGAELTVPVVLGPAPKLAREMKRSRNEKFEFTVRNMTFSDESRTQEGAGKKVKGVVAESVDEGGWAAIGRLAVGDIIMSANGTKVTNVAELEQVMKDIEEQKPETVVFHVQRGISEMFVEVVPDWDTE